MADTAQTPQGWQPIDTAPRGVEVVLYFPPNERHRLGPYMVVSVYPPTFPRQPTHWLPLPPAPPESHA